MGKKVESNNEEHKKIETEIPEYLKSVYSWFYLNPKIVKFLDKPFVANVMSWGLGDKLNDAIIKETKEGQKVLQIAATYGNQISQAAGFVGAEGQYDIVDVVPLQLDNCKEKLELFSNVNFYHSDAEFFNLNKNDYDLIVSFFLLHEMPDAKKRRVIDNVLKNLKPESKVVFVDYHKPKCFNIIGFFMLLLNRLFEPFAESLWEQEISSFATNPEQYEWQKTTYFAGLYQKVVVKKIK